MLLLHYTGGRWVRVPVPLADPQRLSGFLSFVVMSSPTDGWIVGDSYAGSTNSGQGANAFVLLHYNGTKWTEVATPNIQSRGGYTISSISVPAPGDVWVVGSAMSIPGSYTVGPQGGGPIITTTPVIMRYHDGAWTVYSS